MCSKCLVSCLVAIVCAANGWAQASRITQTIDSSRPATLAGHLHPKAQAAADQGRVAPSLPLPYITLTLAPAASQQADLQELLSAQQTKGNSDYHHWLTPEEYAHRFGLSDADIDKITQWLTGQGLKVLSVARSYCFPPANKSTMPPMSEAAPAMGGSGTLCVLSRVA
jgi:hypothetical protein